MIISFLTKVLVKPYYQQNVGFFLIVLGIAGSFMRSAEHIALATYAVHSWSLLAMLYFSVWLLYTFKVIQYVLKTLKEPQHEFLYLLRLLPVSTQLVSLMAVQVSLLAPVLVYGLFVISQGIIQRTWGAIGLILLFVGLLITLPLFMYLRTLRQPNAYQNVVRASYFFNLRFTKPYALFFVQYLLQQQRMLTFLTKAFTLLMLLGVCWLYPTDDYDERLLSLGLLLAGLAHVSIAFQFHQFEQHYLLLYRNLPLTTLQRFGRYALVYSLLWIPEIAVLLRNLPSEVSYGYALQAIAFGLGLTLLNHHYLYYKPRSLEDSMQVVFWALIGFFFLIMFRLPIAGLALGMLLLSFYLFRRYYKRVAYPIQ
ncbi:MAG: hypothetical protein U0Y10_00120 [Spirosomataceae bacterium]